MQSIARQCYHSRSNPWVTRVNTWFGTQVCGISHPLVSKRYENQFRRHHHSPHAAVQVVARSCRSGSIPCTWNVPISVDTVPMMFDPDRKVQLNQGRP
jgi:hypothetical protein